MSLVVRPETTADRTAVWQVNRLAFGGDAEAMLVEALHTEGFARVSLIAEAGREVVGHILFSQLAIVTTRGTVEGLSLAPLAVVPSHQRMGIGSSLVAEGLRICREAGHEIVVVLGHPRFYPRFGFSPKLAERLRSPYSCANFMALELVPRALDGVEGEVRYPPPFESL